MTGTFRSGRRIACFAVLAAVTLSPITACAAGYQAETSRERTTLTSVSGAVGDLTLRNVFFVGPSASGGSLPLYLSIFNGGSSDDTLTRVTSGSSSGGAAPANASIPAGGAANYVCGKDDQVPELTGLKSNVSVGQTIKVTLTFAQAGDVTMTVPVEPTYLYDPSPTGSPAADASSTVCPTPSASPTESATPSSSESPSSSPTPSASAS